MRVLVAGAGGFIGSALAALLLARGHSVVAFGRTAANVGALPPTMDRVTGDVRDPGAVASAAKDCDAIAHLALPDISSKYRVAYPIWIEGTRNLLAAATERGMKAFAIASGAMGNYRHEPGAWVDETATIEPANRLMKGRAEAVGLALQAAREHGLRVAVLRPPYVYGRGGPFGKYFIDLMRQKRFRVVGDGSNFTGFVHVADCALAYALALERAPRGEQFVVVDDTPVTLREASDTIAESLGMRHPGTVPPILARLVVGSAVVQLATESLKLRNAKAKAALGWTPRYPSLRDGLPSVVA